MYDTSYWEGEIGATVTRGFLDEVVGVVIEMDSSSAVTFCCSVHGLPLVSVTSTMTCVGQLAVGQLSKTDISFLLSHSLKLTQSP